MPNKSTAKPFKREKSTAKTPSYSTAGDFIAQAIDDSLDIKLIIAGNWMTSAETLAILAKHKDSKIRRRVASNFNTSTETLDMLSSDKDKNVRMNVAGNSNTGADTLDKLAKANKGDKNAKTWSPA